MKALPSKRTISGWIKDRCGTLSVIPELAEAIGLEKAIILFHLAWLLHYKENGVTYEGKRWVFNTYAEWCGHFPWLNARQIATHMRELEKMGYVESCRPPASQQKYYRASLSEPQKKAIRKTV